MTEPKDAPRPPGNARHYRRFLSTDPALRERLGDPFRPLEPECRVVQFDAPLTPSQLARAGRLIADRPDIELYVYGGVWRDLSFLKHFKTVQRLHIALYELQDIAGFSDARWLRELTFGETRKKFSLRVVETWPLLRRLFLVRHKTDLACISGLAELENLGLSGITLPDLSLLLPLGKLRALQLFLGGTTGLGALAKLPLLEELRMMRVTKLSELGILADLAGLRRLHLDWMRNVVSLPNLGGLSRLEAVKLDTMKGLTELVSIAAAPALRRLEIGGMPQLTADNFRCFIGHPRLCELLIQTGRRGVDAAVREMLPQIARRF
jgi:hypothetical protein